jgi:hypothetical protein
MFYVVYHKETTHFLRIYRHGCWTDANRFETEAAAKACLTREAKKPGTGNRDKVKKAEFGILPRDEFDKIQKTEVRYGVGPCAGKEYTVNVNASWTSGPWSETYWSS